MKTLTVQDLLDELEDLPPTRKVLISLGDGTEDQPLTAVLVVTDQVILCANPTSVPTTMIQFFVHVSSEEPPMYCVEVSEGSQVMRVGPESYDMLIVESVTQELYERMDEFMTAYGNDKHHDFVASLFDKRGGP